MNSIVVVNQLRTDVINHVREGKAGTLIMEVRPEEDAVLFLLDDEYIFGTSWSQGMIPFFEKGLELFDAQAERDV